MAELLTDLQKLYRDAEKATEVYNGAEQRLQEQQRRVRDLDAALARARLSLRTSRAEAGKLARQQYQSTPASPPTYGCCWPAIRSTPSTRAMSSGNWPGTGRARWAN
ncbi:hypothetical protein SFUMM280S_09024 [Streptomyces fumanus]